MMADLDHAAAISSPVIKVLRTDFESISGLPDSVPRVALPQLLEKNLGRAVTAEEVRSIDRLLEAGSHRISLNDYVQALSKQGSASVPWSSSSMSTTEESGCFPKRQVWVGCIKLAAKQPGVSIVQDLLYSSPTNSAEDADVIALYFTDLQVTKKTLNEMQSLLRRSLRDPENYFVNEDNDFLPLKHLPAILMSASEGYMSLHVAVHKRNVIDTDLDARGDGMDQSDCFPTSPEIICTESGKMPPGMRAVIVQRVLLYHRGETLDLFLMGVNLCKTSPRRSTRWRK